MVISHVRLISFEGVDEGLKCQRLMSACVGLHFEAGRVFCVEAPHAARAR